jgi:hypothetical protein
MAADHEPRPDVIANALRAGSTAWSIVPSGPGRVQGSGDQVQASERGGVVGKAAAGSPSVADYEEGVVDAAVAQVGERCHPELRALTAGAGPEPEDVAFAGQCDGDDRIERPIGDPARRGP